MDADERGSPVGEDERARAERVVGDILGDSTPWSAERQKILVSDFMINSEDPEQTEQDQDELRPREPESWP